jgi:hypothetical protein
VPSANNAPGNGSFAARISNLFATALLPQLLKLSEDFLDQGDQRQFLDFELELHKQALQFSDRVTEQALLEKIYNPELIEQAIKHYQAKGFHVHSRKKSTTVQLYGGKTLAIKTVYMLPTKKNKKGRRRGVGRRGRKGKGVYPVLKMLGIAHQASPALQNETTLSALNNAFAEATENLERHGVELSEKRVRTISENVGATALQERATKIEQFNKGQLPAGDTFAGQNVVVAIDGGRTRMRQTKTGKKKKGQKRQGFYTEWKEPKLFTIYATDDEGKKLNQKIRPFCDGTTMGRDAFKALLKMYLLQTGVLQAKHITFIGDGSEWIWNVVAEIISEMNLDPAMIDQVLDFYHATEHLWEMIDAMPKLTRKQKNRLFKQAKKQLKSGRIDGLLETFGKKTKAGQKAHKKLQYFIDKKERCRYDVFIAKKIPIGSGAIESAIRRVVNLRLKGAGMFWLQENAEAFLHLRCQLKVGRWNDYFASRLSL